MKFCAGWWVMAGLALTAGSGVVFPLGVAAQEPAAKALAAKEFAPKEPVSYIELGDYRLYMGVDSNAYAVYSAKSKQWTSYNFAKHLTVKPTTDGERAGFPMGWSQEGGSVVSPGPLVAFEMGDAPIEELVAVDAKGRFCTHKLPMPIKRTIKPFLLGQGLMYYIVDGKIYAFSGVTGTWDMLEVPEIPEPKWKDGVVTQPPLETGFDTSNSGQIVIKLPFGKMTFAADQGRWKLERKAAAEEVSLPAVK
jgi:hypothetical protein